MALFSCEVLDENNWREKWEPVFDGAHIVMGFETVGDLDESQGTEFVTRMTGGLVEGTYYPAIKIRNAWIQTLKHTIDRSDVSGAYISAEPCQDDYLPGYGHFCSEPVMSSNENYVINLTPFDCTKES